MGKGLKGLQAEEGLHTLEMSFAVDPHGSGVHGSRPAPTCWVRKEYRARRPREHGSSRPADWPVASLLQLTTTPTPYRYRVCLPSFPGQIRFKVGRRKKQSTNEWAAAVEDLKTRHAAAAPVRAPHPLSRRAPCSASRSPPRARLLAVCVPPLVPRLLASRAPPSPAASSPPAPLAFRSPLPQIRALRSLVGVAALPWTVFVVWC